MMATVLRNLRHTDIVTADPVLGPYLARCEARPAFQKALADQLALFAANAPQPEPA
jgi:glutathione S-transferase